MSFKFECPNCKQHYEADEEYHGMPFECVSCKKNFQIPAQCIRRKSHCKKFTILFIAIFAIFVVSSFYWGKTVFSNFAVATSAQETIQQQTTADFEFTVNAPNEKSAKSIAQYYAIHKTVSLLEERDISFDKLPAGITADLSKFVTKIDVYQVENASNKYKATVSVDIQKIKQNIPEYWNRTIIQKKDINALFERRNTLSDIMREMDKIFADYPSQVYSGVRKGMFEVAAKDSSDESNATLEMTYEVSFNDKAYQRLKKRLQNLLSKVALAQESGTTDNSDNIFGSWHDSFIAKFNKSEASKSWATGTKAIAFVDEYWNGQTKMFKYHFYAVPNQIYEKIDNLTSDFGVIVFDFHLSGREKPLKRYIQPSMNFFWRSGYYGNRSTFVFKNWMYIRIPNYDGQETSKHEFKKTWKFTEDQIRAMKSCTLKMYSGQQARYIWYSDDRSSMYGLAYEGYLPAMLAMAEQFNEKLWYHSAALMGSKHAQQQVNWQNGGLGFEIKVTNNGFMVWSARKGIGVKKGMILKSINGSDVPRYTEDVSKLIGAFHAGESVSIEFTNGKTINVRIKKR